MWAFEVLGAGTDVEGGEISAHVKAKVIGPFGAAAQKVEYGLSLTSIRTPFFAIHSPSKCLARCFLKIHILPQTSILFQSAQNAPLDKVSHF